MAFTRKLLSLDRESIAALQEVAKEVDEGSEAAAARALIKLGYEVWRRRSPKGGDGRPGRG